MHVCDKERDIVRWPKIKIGLFLFFGLNAVSMKKPQVPSCGYETATA